MLPEIIGSTVRTTLATAAGGLIAKGYIDATTLDMLIGGVIGLMTLGWSIWQKKKAKA